MTVYELVAKLSLENEDYKKKLNESERSAKSFGSKIGSVFKIGGKAVLGFTSAVAVAGVAVAKIISNTISLGDEIDKQSQQMNMSTDAYQKWKLTAEQNGTTMEKIKGSMKRLTEIIDNANNGNADAIILLNKMGISYEKLADKSPEDVLKAVVEQFQDMKAGADKTQLAIDLFSDSGQDLLPILNMQKGSLDELWQSYEDLGLIMDEQAIDKSAELSDQMLILKQKFKMVGVGLASELLPFLGSFVSNLLGVISGAEGAGDALKNDLFNMLDYIVENLPQWVDAGMDIVLSLVEGILDPEVIDKVIGSMGDIVETLLLGIAKALPVLIGAIPDIAFSVIDTFINMDWWEIGKAIILGIIQGLETFVTKLWDKIKDIGKSIGNWFKNVLGIHSPSKVMAEQVGKPIAQGIGVGFEDEMPDIGEDMTKSLKKNTDTTDLLNGISGMNRINSMQTSNNQFSIYIGEREIKNYIVKTVNDTMKARGLKNLTEVGGYA